MDMDMDGEVNSMGSGHSPWRTLAMPFLPKDRQKR